MMASQDRFGYEWSKYDKIIKDYEVQFLKWVYPLKKEDFRGKVILDAGCGTGRNSYWPLKYGAKKVVAFDYDKRSVKVAKRNLREFDNFEVHYDSIFYIDYKNKFDIAFSIGVIHHLEDPLLAVKKLKDSVKKGGIVLIWVYGYEGNEWIVKYVNPIRRVTSRLPLWLVNMLTYGFSIPFYSYLKLFPQKKPYFRQLKRFRFWHVHSIAFDQLIPTIAYYWKKDEAMSLLKKNGLKDVRAFRVNENSWTVIGRK